jgi:hypothetical protein
MNTIAYFAAFEAEIAAAEQAGVLFHMGETTQFHVMVLTVSPIQ